MFEGLYSMYGNRISDIGGRRVLGMGGSLNAYIQTGNAYTGLGNVKADCYKNKKSSRAKIDKFVSIGVILAAGGALVYAFKKGKLNKETIKNAANKAKEFYSSAKSGNAKEAFKNAFNSFKTKAKEATHKAKDAAKEAAKKAKNAADDAVNKAKDAAGQAAKSANNIPKRTAPSMNVDVDYFDKAGNNIGSGKTSLRFID